MPTDRDRVKTLPDSCLGKILVENQPACFLDKDEP